ncbi:hypothetical protein K9L97_03060 [Candidatus Woesearchaeota archaeon]|nr:hypothetical protein [Candidatus Woesearchaeota archaeon]
MRGRRIVLLFGFLLFLVLMFLSVSAQVSQEEIDLSLGLLGRSSGVMDCYVHNLLERGVSCLEGFDVSWDLQLSGHFNQAPGHGFYLCCSSQGRDAAEVYGLNSVDFFVAKTGHVRNYSQGKNYNDNGGGLEEVDVGALSCTVRNVSACLGYEEELLAVSNPVNGHVGSTSDTTSGNPGDDKYPYPGGHSFKYSLCCTTPELCWDGTDNDGDGFVDCADPDCYGSDIYPGTGIYGTSPQLCTGSPFDTSGCSTGVVGQINESCQGPNDADDLPQHFYCSYGLYDEFNLRDDNGELLDDSSQVGVCCPVGMSAFYNDVDNLWECRERDECGVAPSFVCKFSFLDDPDLVNRSWFNK